ncbi:MAG: type II secretion system protein N [Betaproteobacteria bacterium]
MLAAALAIEAPATLLDQRIAALSQDRVRVAAAAGSLWRGSGELTLLPDGTRIPIAWRLEPLPLLRGRLVGSLTVDDANHPASFTVGQEDFSAHDFALTLPAAAVLRTAGVPDGLAVAGGTLALEVADLARRGDRLEGRVDLRWKDAALPDPRSGTRIALGEIHIAAAGSGAQIPATLTNSGGDVTISGSLVFSTRDMPRIDAKIAPRAGLPAERTEAIAAILAGIGRADGTGGYRIVWPLVGR